ncbi:DUF2975 domain-containing protein [Alkaliphilus hydrothermalis]|uniref:DUF2975 domain-containing protein n=1 Tax=Alkaliphilus hydrothermalis TaxID=1482730 RepID=A0ABS2NNK3_9FIRM|nr:DUF2975 domain-containing protein [Alkaliphilus hydrothermalis]MBM7614525.1 hypothetical protein [Alkaliphilus hydrothermalis]
MKRETLFLKIALVLIGLPIFALAMFILPIIAREAAIYYPAYLVYSIIGSIYITAIPFYFALYQAYKLLSYIDKNNAFSELSVKSLKYIKYCATMIGCIYGAGMPFFYYIGEKDDAPGLILIGIVFTIAPVVIAVFAAVLQKLLQNAIDIKQDNDLTI